jgi:ABC-type multidrug transport system fused ATPase/permease subunit
MFTTLQTAMAGGEQVLNLLDTPPDVADLPDAGDMPPILGNVKFDHVSFHYRPGLPEVLHDLNLTIEAGQTIALVGPTGAGKTSIGNLIARFYDVSGGMISIDGVDVRSVAQRSMHRQIGLVPQDSFLFASTIADNIRFGLPEASDDEVERAARLANAHEFIAAKPEGYQTRVLEGAANLSVGQRQLICIARVILTDPRILIMDEATANVDSLTESLIQEALRNLLRGRTAVVIAHRLSTVRGADQLLVIKDGDIIERGTHDQLIEQQGFYQRMYLSQFNEKGMYYPNE